MQRIQSGGAISAVIDSAGWKKRVNVLRVALVQRSTYVHRSRRADPVDTNTVVTVDRIVISGARDVTRPGGLDQMSSALRVVPISNTYDVSARIARIRTKVRVLFGRSKQLRRLWRRFVEECWLTCPADMLCRLTECTQISIR